MTVTAAAQLFTLGSDVLSQPNSKKIKKKIKTGRGKELQGLNFINVLRTNFSYERTFWQLLLCMCN